MSLPPLVDPANELTNDEVRRYSRHLIIPDVGMAGQNDDRQMDAARRQHFREHRAHPAAREVSSARFGVVAPHRAPEDTVQAPRQPEYKNND